MFFDTYVSGIANEMVPVLLFIYKKITEQAQLEQLDQLRVNIKESLQHAGPPKDTLTCQCHTQ